jgi:inosine-uridine nucleoside N-ribohydrolase
MSDNRIAVIYDTDLGEDIDDLYALYLALFHPRIRVLAVTTVHGDTQAKARLAAKVLRMAGRPDVPVGAGIGMSAERIRRKQIRPDPNEAASFVGYVTAASPPSFIHAVANRRK